MLAVGAAATGRRAFPRGSDGEGGPRRVDCEVPEVRPHPRVLPARVPRRSPAPDPPAQGRGRGVAPPADPRHKRLMYARWGLEKVVRKTKGLSLLFAGPPGTGKTMAAEAIAHELGRPLPAGDSAQLETMWGGGAGKNTGER